MPHNEWYDRGQRAMESANEETESSPEEDRRCGEELMQEMADLDPNHPMYDNWVEMYRGMLSRLD